MTREAYPGWKPRLSRHQVSNVLGLSVVPLLAGKSLPLAFAAGSNDEDPWRAAEAILQRIQPLFFPDRDDDITRFGAVDDGRRLIARTRSAKRSRPAPARAADASSCRAAGS